MNKKKVVLIISMFIGVIVLALASSYAIFTINVTKNTDFKIVLGHLELKITDTETEDKYILENVVPTKDSEALSQEGYTFTVTNTGTMDSYYTVYLDDIILDNAGTRLNNNYVKVNLYNHKTTRSDTKMLSDYPEIDRVLASGTLNKGESITYTLRMWVDYNAGNDAQSKYMATQIRVVGEQLNALVYQEEVLKGADPVLTENLIPVVIDDNGVVTKANIKEEWYSYKDKKWANAVVLKDRYDENTIYDLSGNGNNATIYGATITDEGLYFDGLDDYAKVDLLDFKSTTEYTIEFEAAITLNEKTKSLFELSNNANKNPGTFILTNQLGGNDLNFGTFHNGDYTRSAANAISNKEMKKYTVTFNSNNVYDKFLNVYVNGIKQDLTNPLGHYTNISGSVIQNHSFYIGSRSGQTFFTEMTLKSLKIYTRELTEEEIINNTTTDKLILMYDLNNYSDNEIIPEESIESYFVWIPKYSYKLWDLGNYSSLTTIESKEHTIPIKFGLTNTSDSVTGECTTPGIAGESGNCKVGDYMTHPAFLAFDTNGLWVGKFETGYDGATSTEEAQTDTNKVDTSKIIIKPNSYSWRNINIGNAFKNSYDYLRNNESHMMKNTEWGAVAYLSHSDYGINKEIRINNNSNYITGYAGTEPPIGGFSSSVEGNRYETTSVGVDGTYTVNYLNSSSVISSTTGNYTGIYDMSGGSYEYVMGYTSEATQIGGGSEIMMLYSSFFEEIGWEKYYDRYSSTSSVGYFNRIIGDATGEIGPFTSQLDPDNNRRNKSSWYVDYSYFATDSYPWFYRGDHWISGTYAGVFAFSGHVGSALTTFSFRIVLAPTK